MRMMQKRLIQRGLHIFHMHPDLEVNSLNQLLGVAHRQHCSRSYDRGCALLAEYMAEEIDKHEEGDE